MRKLKLIFIVALLALSGAGLILLQRGYSQDVPPPSDGPSTARLASRLESTQDQQAQLQKTVEAQNNQIQNLSGTITDLKDQLNKQNKALDSVLQNEQATTSQLSDMTKTTESKFTAIGNTTATGVSLNIVWTLVTGYLVMFMQAGFALVETGFTRSKNVAHTMMLNFMVYTIAMMGFWVCGFAIQFGGTGSDNSCSQVSSLGVAVTNVLNTEYGITLFGHFFGFAGGAGFGLQGVALDGGIFALFLFQLVFMDTAATIPTGSMSERWKFLSFCIFSFIVGAFIYPMFGNWVWGGGWLAALGKNFGLGHGHVDFAGSSVVHMCGGVMALVGAWVLGPRIGKYNPDGTPNAIPGHNLPMAILGTFILAFGWFGFNPGSTLSGTDPQIGIIAGNTMLASGGGAIAAMIIAWIRIGKPDPSFAANGMLAGLVAITAPCAFVDAWAAVVLGAIAGIIMFYSVFFVEEVLKIDDPVGAISVHGTCGAWGVLSLGIFANGQYGEGWNGVDGKVTGMILGDFSTGFHFGNVSQFLAECIGTITNFVFIGGVTWVVLTLIGLLVGNRVTAAEEIRGLDISEMGALGYSNES